ncbi:hypothetical protein RD792_001816 [Penstemon davidsonii]|uniref:AMP-activated protein kinase glycogen-binding domain-containing protein n=1 Tax=Penstemon davidsonii TaxID=160366 RepID=A0ABR0DPD5_9LAMI|nr:hypothetical protein RD792_001816 [Penstemon davidsonii]
MFGNLETGNNSSAVVIPTQFVWPHGGRRVLLSGTFTRWQDHVTMSPIEGCPTTFQVICNLSPVIIRSGLHQAGLSLRFFFATY